MATSLTGAMAEGSRDARSAITALPVEPERGEIGRFVRAVFAEAPLRSSVTLRSFYDDGNNGPPFQSRFVQLQDESDLELLVETAYLMAKTAAACARPVVFCPSLATYAKRSAKAQVLVAGLCLTVECDERAEEARRTLSNVLGRPSLTVASGGTWTNPETGEVEEKLHLHWILREPALTPEEHNALRKVRALACDLVGADASSKAIVHPLRWPGSVHRKKEPRLCRILEDTGCRIDLGETLAELRGLEELRETIETDGATGRRQPEGESEPLSSDLLEGCADRIPNDDLEWAKWNRLGMAFWRASGGSARGFAAFDTWSKKSSKYDSEAPKARWEHYSTSPPERVGAGTLVFLARKADPSFRRRQPERPQEAGVASPTWNVELGAEFEPFRQAVAEVNERFFVVQMGGSVVIGSYARDDTLGRETLYFVKPSDFILKFKSRKYLVGYTQRNKEIWKSLGEAWLEASMRREYDRAAMVCRGECPLDTLNLWRGWGAEPKDGDWQVLAEHLLDVICGGDEECYLYLVRLLARWVQYPERQGDVAIVLRGEKGTGKGTVADIIKRWFRHHSVHISQSKHLTGHFNAHLTDCLFLFADEVVWGGDKQAEGALKALVTERVVHIEPKGVNSFQAPNRLKIMMASNGDWVVPVSAEERRYLVLDVQSTRLGNRSYFNRLHEAIEGGEAEAMLHDMLHMDLSDFDHRTVPHTDGLNRQKMEGLDSVGRWWASCLTEGRIVGILNDDPTFGAAGWPKRVAKATLHVAYVKHAHDHGERHPKPENTFPTRFKELAPSIKSGQSHNGQRCWLLQDLDTHRDEFLMAMRIDRYDWADPSALATEGANVTQLKTRF